MSWFSLLACFHAGDATEEPAEGVPLPGDAPTVEFAAEGEEPSPASGPTGRAEPGGTAAGADVDVTIVPVSSPVGGGSGAVSPSGEPTGSEVEAPAPAPVGGTEPNALRMPTPGLTLACGDRIEGPSTSGECSVDSDCARAGCSGEVCVAASRRTEIVTTCERLPCFDTLDACVCDAGVCGWTLREATPRKMPEPQR